MKILKFTITLLMSLFVLGCENKSRKDWVNPLVCDFNKEKGSITQRLEFDNDIKAVPTILNELAPDRRNNNYRDVPIPHGVDLQFFNYGEDLKIINGAIEDIFLTGSTFCYYYTIEAEQISIDNVHNSKTYGAWATVHCVMGDEFVGQVFLSPLAYRFMMKNEDERERDSNHLIYVRMIEPSENICFNGVFLGDLITYSYVQDRPDLVEYYHSIHFTGASDLWHPILNKDGSLNYTYR